MKTLIMFLMLITVNLFAEEVPEYMRDGKIVVTLKNGKTYEYSLNTHMVVRRGVKKLIPVDVLGTSKPHQDHFEEELHHKNRVRFLAGVGPTGLQTSQSANTVKVETDYGFVGGIGYDRSLNNRFSLGITGFTNGTIAGGLGYDF